MYSKTISPHFLKTTIFSAALLHRGTSFSHHVPPFPSMMPARPAAVRCLSSTVMYLARAAALGAAVVVCLASTATAFISGGSMSLRTSVPFVGRTYVSSPMQRQLQRATHVPRRRLGINSLRATSDQEEEQSGFVNPYTAFRKWQLELVRSSLLWGGAGTVVSFEILVLVTCVFCSSAGASSDAGWYGLSCLL